MAKIAVAPLVGAWIEISGMRDAREGRSVAPLVGAWIEICKLLKTCRFCSSLPSWERGLKYVLIVILNKLHTRRSPRGSVD